MCVEATSIRTAIGHDEPGRDRDRIPTSAQCNLCGHASFAIECSDQLVHVGDIGLELDDQHGTATWVPTQNVDDAAIRVDGERDLGDKGPRRKAVAEPPSHRLMQRGMPRIEQSIEIACAPARHQVHSDIERPGYRSNAIDRHWAGMTALQPRYDGLRHPAPRRQVGLPPATPLSHQPNHRPEPLIVHRPQCAHRRSPATYRRGLGGRRGPGGRRGLGGRLRQVSVGRLEGRDPTSPGRPIGRHASGASVTRGRFGPRILPDHAQQSWHDYMPIPLQVGCQPCMAGIGGDPARAAATVPPPNRTIVRYHSSPRPVDNPPEPRGQPPRERGQNTAERGQNAGERGRANHHI